MGWVLMREREVCRVKVLSGVVAAGCQFLRRRQFCV